MRFGLLLVLFVQAAGAQTASAGLHGWSFGPVDLSALVDAYYSLNFNQPSSGTNQLRNFDVESGRLSLSMAKVTLEDSTGPLGFRLDLGFGKAFEIVNSSEKFGALRHVEQAFASWKPAGTDGAQFDFGKFTTSAGAEVIETNENWNYSRSLLFTWAIPYYHFGLRASVPLDSHFTTGVQLVNGWNNVADGNGGKAVGLTGNFTLSKLTWSHAYYAGREGRDLARSWRYVYDSALRLAPRPGADLYLNVDYGANQKLTGASGRWVGLAGATRLSPVDWFALSPRLEWFNDADGFSTGAAQKLKEFTITAEFKMPSGVLVRPEYRRDWSDHPFFSQAGSAGAATHQDTLLVGVIVFFSKKG